MNFNEIRWAICIQVKAKLVLNDAWSSFYPSFKSWMRTVGSWTVEHALIEPKLWWLYLLSCLVIVKKLGAGGSYFLLEIYYISFRSLFFYIWHLFICLFYLFPLCNLVTWFKNSIWFFSINPPLTYFYENDTHQLDYWNFYPPSIIWFFEYFPFCSMKFQMEQFMELSFFSYI